MKVVAFVKPPQADMIERIPRRRWLRCSSSPAGDRWVHAPDGNADSEPAFSREPREFTYADMDTFWSTC